MGRNPAYSILLHSGVRFWPLDPQPELICIEDIAHALSQCCRFTGHTHTTYSIAQHSVLVCRHLPPDLALCGLLHDAGEAYLSDIASPVKAQMPFYRDVEAKLEQAIAERFSLPFPWPPEVKHADRQAVVTEKRDLMPKDNNPMGFPQDVEPWPELIEPWSARTAKFMFLLEYRRCMGLAGDANHAAGAD